MRRLQFFEHLERGKKKKNQSMVEFTWNETNFTLCVTAGTARSSETANSRTMLSKWITI